MRTWYLTFVDTSNEYIIDYVTDYDHLNLHYERLDGGRVGKCEKCGKLFRYSKTNKSKYCYKHRSYNKVEEKQIRVGICIDCGNEFYVAATNTKKCRCDYCQKIVNLQKNRDRVNKYRNKNKL